MWVCPENTLAVRWKSHRRRTKSWKFMRCLKTEPYLYMGQTFLSISKSAIFFKASYPSLMAELCFTYRFLTGGSIITRAASGSNIAVA